METPDPCRAEAERLWDERAEALKLMHYAWPTFFLAALLALFGFVHHLRGTGFIVLGTVVLAAAVAYLEWVLWHCDGEIGRLHGEGRR